MDDPFVHLTEDEDRQRAFAAVPMHLAPGGRFILDAAWLPPERRHAAETENLVEDQEAGGRPLGARDLELRGGEPALHDSLRNRGRRPSRSGGFLSRRLWSLAELEKRAEAAGLASTRMWGGDYDRRPWDRGTSPRLIVEMRLK